jgi:hypothetical protein
VGHELPEPWGEIVTTFGAFTASALSVAFLYELLFAQKRDTAVVLAVLKDPAILAEITRDVTEGLVPGATKVGLVELVQRMDFIRLFEELRPGDELLYLATYIEIDFDHALRDALARGARVRLLAINPESLCLRMRAEELTPYYRDRYYQDMARTYLYRLQAIQDPKLQIATYSDLPNMPMFLVLRDGLPAYGFTGSYLTGPIIHVTHLKWNHGIMLHECVLYFNKKWIANHELNNPVLEDQVD